MRSGYFGRRGWAPAISVRTLTLLQIKAVMSLFDAYGKRSDPEPTDWQSAIIQRFPVSITHRPTARLPVSTTIARLFESYAVSAGVNSGTNCRTARLCHASSA